MFEQARLKLTLWYLSLIMLVSVMFSGVIYRVLVNEVVRFEKNQRYKIEERIGGECFDAGGHKQGQLQIPVPAELVEEAKSRVFLALIIVNMGILVFAGVFGYLLAGRTLEPIQDMVEEQHRFVSDASHELKTPLTSLKSAFEVHLRSKKRTLKDADLIITESLEEVNKLQRLSESLLKLAQYGRPNVNVMTTLSLETVIQEAVHKVEQLAKQKKISLTVAHTDAYVKGDSTRLVELFVIMLDNAIKYSPEKESVILKIQPKRDMIKVTVEDHGIGIDKKDIDKIFDRFYRADQARSKQNTGGYGLGLSIAQKIVEAHHGELKVQSEVGKRTAFIVALPITQRAKKIHAKK
jgi:two-component system, OmpR family, sensor histidine kinase CiaH